MTDPTLPATPIHPGDPGNAANLTLIVDAIRAILQRTNLLETEGGQQAAALIGELEALTTADKSSVVAAINEAVASIAEVDERDGNLLADGSFEVGTDGWIAGAGVSIDVSLDDPLDGVQSLEVTLDGSHAPGDVVLTRTVSGLTVGAVYEFAFSASYVSGDLPALTINVESSDIDWSQVPEAIEPPAAPDWSRWSIRFRPNVSTVVLPIVEVYGEAGVFRLDSVVVQAATDYTDQIIANVAPVATLNLLADGSFERGTDGWFDQGGTVSQVEGDSLDPGSLDGGFALLVDMPTSSPGTLATNRVQSFNVMTGQVYEVSLYVLAVAGDPVIQLQFGWAGGYVHSSEVPLSAASPEWIRISARVRAIGTALSVELNEMSGAAVQFAVDSVMLRPVGELVAPEFVGPLTVVPADGSPDEGLRRYSVRDEDTWDEFAADSDVTATADGGTRARGTLDAPEAVELGDILRYLWWWEGHDGAGYSIGSVAYLQVDDDVSEGIVPTALVVEQADETGALVERLRIGSNGALTLPHASSHADGGSDEIAVGLAQITQSGATTGQVPKWSGSAWVPDDETGGGGGGGGGLVLVDSGTFSGSSGFNVDGVFDSTYDDYLVVLVTNGSTDIQLGFRLRASGTDSSSNYSGARLFAYGTTAGVQVNNLGSDEWQINNVGLSGPPGVARLDLYGPAVAAPSAMLGVSGGYFSSTGTITTHLNGSHDVSTAYDGFAVRPDAGTITGRWAVYGYPK